MQALRTQLGFTLLELLMVITIAAIITGLTLNIYPNIQKRIRDGQRKAHLKLIASALEQYYQKYGQYPPGNGGANRGILFKLQCPKSLDFRS